MAPTSQEDARAEAAIWFTKMRNRHLPLETVADFRRWRADPGNDRAYREMEALWRETGGLEKDPDIQGALIDALSRSKQKRRIAKWMPAAAMAGSVAVLALGYLVYDRLSGPVFETGVGEQKLVKLADGSALLLDTDTKVAVRYSKDRRRLLLTRGQARFEVTHDPARAFVVEAGKTEVTALGTKFDVRRMSHGARVLLLEGRVTVVRDGSNRAVQVLAPGEQFDDRAGEARRTRPPADEAGSWSQGMLTFHRVPLAEAIAEVNRYTKDKVRLDGDRLGEARVSGVFRAGDVGAFAAAVGELYDLTASVRPDGGIDLRPASGG